MYVCMYPRNLQQDPRVADLLMATYSQLTSSSNGNLSGAVGWDRSFLKKRLARFSCIAFSSVWSSPFSKSTKGRHRKAPGNHHASLPGGGATWQLDRSLKMALPKRKSCQGDPWLGGWTTSPWTWKYSVNHPPGFGDDPTMVINHVSKSWGWSSKYELHRVCSCSGRVN